MVLFELEWNEVWFSGLTKLPVTDCKELDMTAFRTPFFYHGHADMPATPAAAPAGKLNAIHIAREEEEGKKGSGMKRTKTSENRSGEGK